MKKYNEFIQDAAEAGYRAYARQAGGKSVVTGDRLPEWKYLSEYIKNAWLASTEAILAYSCTTEQLKKEE